MRRVLLLPLLVFLFAFLGCAPADREPVPAPASRVVLQPAEVRAQLAPWTPILGDTSYTPVTHDWFISFYPKFRQDLFDRGVVRWDSRFDCNQFAGYFVSSAQIRFFVDNFHSSIKAQALALGQCWFWQAGRGPHAVVIGVTERGVEFFDPQLGRFIDLTPAERQSIYLIFF